MIKEFLSQMKAAQPVELDTYQKMVEHKSTVTKLFDGYIDLLRNNDSFPNKEINKLFTLTWRLIGNKHILTGIDPSGTMPSLAFSVIESAEGKQQGVVFIPQNFISSTAKNPEMLVGSFAFVASQCRDYYVGKVPAENEQETQEIVARAVAFEVEALKTLESLAAEASVTLTIPPFQRKRFNLYPDGLSSLKKDVNYLTPDYVGKGKLPFQPSQN